MKSIFWSFPRPRNANNSSLFYWHFNSYIKSIETATKNYYIRARKHSFSALNSPGQEFARKIKNKQMFCNMHCDDNSSKRQNQFFNFSRSGACSQKCNFKMVITEKQSRQNARKDLYCVTQTKVLVLHKRFIATARLAMSSLFGLHRFSFAIWPTTHVLLLKSKYW